MHNSKNKQKLNIIYRQYNKQKFTEKHITKQLNAIIFTTCKNENILIPFFIICKKSKDSIKLLFQWDRFYSLIENIKFTVSFSIVWL